MIINHNIAALNTYNRLMLNNVGVSKSLEKLSSGMRINRAADDAAGLAISEKMRSQIRGLDQAQRNAQDGISIIQTAEGALSETHSILQRMRELAVQAANDTYTSTDRMNIQAEIDQLTSEVDRIASTTQFNGKNLLDGSTAALVSSDKIATRIFMRDGLRVLDQFGQKSAGGGNFRLDISATAGSAQVQKSDIFKIKHAGIIETTRIADTELCNGRMSEMNVAVAVSTGGTAELCDQLSIQFDFGGGCVYYVCVNSIIAACGTAITLAEKIRSDVNLNKLICASAAAATLLCLVSKVNGQNFTVTSTVLYGSGLNTVASTFAFGTTANTIGQGADHCSGCIIAASYSTNNLCFGTCNYDTNVATLAATKNVIGTVMNSGMMEGNYGINTCRGASLANYTCFGGYYGCNGGNFVNTATTSTCTEMNTSTLFVVNSVCGGISCTAMVSYMTHGVTKTGCHIDNATSWTTVCLTLSATNWIELGAGLGCFQLDLCAAGSVKACDKTVINNMAASNGTTDTAFILTCGDSTGNVYTCFTAFTLCTRFVDNKSVVLNFFQVNSGTGDYKDASLQISTGFANVDKTNAVLFKTTATTVSDSSRIGCLAALTTKLFDVDKFWDPNGNFILDTPQTITLVQGDGKRASITITGADTFGSLRDKLNAVIATGLGQSEVVGTTNTDKFVSFVVNPSESGLEAVKGTFVIRSAIAGKNGEINLVGNDSVIAALSLTTIQTSSYNTYSVDVTEAHKLCVVATCVQIADNNLVGVVHKNVDVQFAANTGLVACWDDCLSTFVLVGGSANYCSTFVHLADRTMVFQIGANQKQDVGAAIGNMGVYALGLENLQVTTNSLSNEALGKIDVAINRVSSQRANLGAVQNRLDHSISSLATTTENLTAAESRIRDVDMAKQMMEFTKFNILSQAATAMLAQANQLPQSVLQLLR